MKQNKPATSCQDPLNPLTLLSSVRFPYHGVIQVACFKCLNTNSHEHVCIRSTFSSEHHSTFHSTNEAPITREIA